MKYFNIQTYGCSANQNNSEILAGLLMQSKYQITSNPDIADILILNTCIVKQKTEDKIKRKIQDFVKEYPKKMLIVAGCMSDTDSKHIKKLAPNVLLLGSHNFKNIINLIDNHRDYLDKKDEEKVFLPKISGNKLIGIVQILEGCLGNCSYCKTKLAKGELHSYPEEKILKSIKSDLQQGAKEIWITSQDCSSYGLDNGKNELVELLRKILELRGRFKLRLGMMNPENLHPLLNEMIKIYSNKKMYKFLHVPIQSGSDKILKEMSRRYDMKLVREIIEKFKEKFPDITIATDIIVGYPGESDDDYKKSLEFVKLVEPNVLNLSKFSKHKGTRAWKLKELDRKIINKRASELMKVHRESALKNKEKFVGRNVRVFVNKKLGDGLLEARDENYNIVLVSFNDKSILGSNVEVCIDKIGVHHLIGKIVG